MKHTFNHRNYRNKVGTQLRHTGTHMVLSALIGIMTLGALPYSFLRNLEIVGCNPFERLNRGQMRQMWFLRAMYRC